MSSQYEEIMRGELDQIRDTVTFQTLREAEAAMVKAMGLLRRTRRMLEEHVPAKNDEVWPLLAEITDLLGD